MTYGTAPQRYYRFYQPASGSDPAKAFIGDGFDWSGIGRVVDGGSVYSWGTMISDTYYVSAMHNRPSTGAQLTFYQGNDLTGSPTSWTATVADGAVFQTGYAANAGLDLVIGHLTAPVPSWVKKYPLIKRMEETNYTSYLDPTILLVGENGPYPNSTFNMQVGRNSIADGPRGLGIDRPYDIDATGLGDDEAWTAGNDSGGPSFAVVGSNLVLAGIHTNPYRDQNISANLNSIRTFFATTAKKIINQCAPPIILAGSPLPSS